MTHPIYGAFGTFLIYASLFGAGIAICVGLFSLVRLIALWKTPDRRRHAVRLACAAAVVPCLLAVPSLYFHIAIEPRLSEITLEPEGGSPTGQPTGPIFGVGRAQTPL